MPDRSPNAEHPYRSTSTESPYVTAARGLKTSVLLACAVQDLTCRYPEIGSPIYRAMEMARDSGVWVREPHDFKLAVIDEIDRRIPIPAESSVAPTVTRTEPDLDTRLRSYVDPDDDSEDRAEIRALMVEAADAVAALRQR